MPFFRLHIDSRSRMPGGSAAQANFALNDAIANTTSIRLKDFVFANTLYNIRKGYNDRLVTSDGDVILQPGYYTPQLLVTALNSSLGENFVSYENNFLIWNTGSTVLLSSESNMKYVLGLTKSDMVGVFSTSLFLAAPMYISLICPELQSTYNLYTGTTSKQKQQEPFSTIYISSSFGQMQTYEPKTLRERNV